MRRIVTLLLPLSIGLLPAAGAHAQTTPPAKAAAKAPAKPAPAPPGRAEKGAARAPAKAAAPAPTDPEAEAQLDELLGKWEEKSATIKTLDASYLRHDLNMVLGEVEFFEGRAVLESPNRAWMDTKKINLDPKDKEEARLFYDAIKALKAPDGVDPVPKEKKEFFERVICTGDAIYHYIKAAKQVQEYPLAKQDRMAALQQGPLPFLFNMRRDDVLKRYKMRLTKETVATYEIQVVPRLDIDKNAFEQAVIHLSRVTFLPEMLLLVDLNQNKQAYFLTRVLPNAKVSPKNFQHDAAAWKDLGYELVKNPPLGGDMVSPPRRPEVGREGGPARR